MKLKTIVAAAAAVAMPLALMPAYAGEIKNDMKATGHDIKQGVEDTGHGIKAEAKEAALTTKVKTALAREKGLRSMHIHVESENGIVTLTGHVKNAAQIEQAVNATKAVEGVTEVKNDLDVKADL